jgi:Domain of unknown function (DUF6285)
MQDEPGSLQLLSAVIRFLRENAAPLLPAREAFDARVAANALELVQRDLESGAAAAAAEHDRLVALLGRDGSLAELNAGLSALIAAGGPDAVTPALRDHLYMTTLEKLRIDQPRYSAYLRALEEASVAPKADKT